MSRLTIQLNVEALKQAKKDKNLETDTQLAAVIGVSLTQLWRVKLPTTDPRHNAPGSSFIAGVILAFGPFESFFSLE
ncbi:MAG: hypothetical protein ACYCYO_00075 [Bacilli bacterium]